ncbi:MAG: GntR family transcriptional regulator [Catenulispora sp.]|nr:GntR family transcriptional regulator [Catenulispora sp.]NUT39986.1 GntR family transcriptional regulator [Thermoactinospora sp.]
MSPQIERPLPPFEQIAQHFRDKIASGELAEGDRIPSIRQIRADWGVAHATAARVIQTLAAEGLVRTASGSAGTVVTNREMGYAPRDRAMGVRRWGRIYPPGEHARIVSADLVPAPPAIADALGVEAGTQVIRRHRITYRGDVPVSASTSWFAGELAETAPLLLATERIKQGTPGYIEERTGRRALRGRDQFRPALANDEIAAELAVDPGSPVLIGRNWFRSDDGEVLEYGEYVSHPDRWQTYEYELI